MKKCLFLLTFAMLAGASAQADDADNFVYPPEVHWPYGGDPYYNPWVIPHPYQRNINWNFDSTSMPLVPVYSGLDDNDLKDLDSIQVAGDVQTYETDPTGLTSRTGFLGFDNRQGSVSAEGNVTIHLNNWESLNVSKHVWVEIEFLATPDVGIEPWVKLPTGFGIVAADQQLEGPLSDNAYRMVIPIKIEPNPPWEEFGLVLQAEPGNYLLIDHAHFATECVPEPATVVLLTTGAAGLLGILRRRWRR